MKKEQRKFERRKGMNRRFIGTWEGTVFGGKRSGERRLGDRRKLDAVK